MWINIIDTNYTFNFIFVYCRDDVIHEISPNIKKKTHIFTIKIVITRKIWPNDEDTV